MKMRPVSRIAKLREEKGLTQLELSQLLEVTESTVANWEKGRSGVECIERVVKLCKIFSCKPEELITYIADEDVKNTTGKKDFLTGLQKLLNTDTSSQVSNSESITEDLKV